MPALDQAPEDTIKRIFIGGVNLIEIQFKRGLRGRTNGRIQLVERLLRLQSGVGGQVRLAVEDLSQMASKKIKLRKLIEAEDFFDGCKDVSRVDEAMKVLGFKTFGNAEVTLSGIELANKIKKGQFGTSDITGPGAMILQVREVALIA